MQVHSIAERLHLSSQLRASLAGCSPDPVRLLAGSRFTQALLNTDFVALVLYLNIFISCYFTLTLHHMLEANIIQCLITLVTVTQ